MRWAILETAVYIDHWEGALGIEDALAGIRRAFIVRHSSVVLSELRRGACTAAARRRVSALHRIAAVQWAPTAEDWWRAGELVRTIDDAHDWEVAKRREFQNDALIALTARHHGGVTGFVPARATPKASAACLRTVATPARCMLVL